MRLRCLPAHVPRMPVTRQALAPRCTGRRPAAQASARPPRHCSGCCHPAPALAASTSTSSKSTRSASSSCRPSASRTVRLSSPARSRSTASTARRRSRNSSIRGTPKSMPVHRSPPPGPQACPSASLTRARLDRATGLCSSLNTTRPRAKVTRFYLKFTSKVRSLCDSSPSSLASTPTGLAKPPSTSGRTRALWKAATADFLGLMS